MSDLIIKKNKQSMHENYSLYIFSVAIEDNKMNQRVIY